MSEATPRPPRPKPRPRPASRSLQRRSIILTVVATILAIIAAGVAVFTATAIANPQIAQRFFGGTPLPTATLFVMNPSATTDPRGTLPPTWTASPTILRQIGTSTPSVTPTTTSTPTVTTTRIPTLTFTPINTVPVGWYEYRATEGKIALQFTATWTALTLKGRDPGNALRQITEDNPVLEASLIDGLGNARLEDLVLIAFDTATNSDPYIVNMNIAYAAIGEGETAEKVRDVHIGIYENNAFYEVLSTDEPTVDGKRAQRIRYTTKYPTEGGEIVIYHQEVIVPQRRQDDPMIIVTLSTSEQRRNIYEAMLDRIVAGIRFMR